MVRTIASAAVLGALIAVGAAYAASQPAWRNVLAAWFGAPERPAATINYIGYAYRRLRQFGPAMQHYLQAVMLNRRHRSAHEHLGELYLVLGEPDKAEQQLATLEDICLIPCEEYEDLKRAIAAYKRLAAR
jgi:tetratricopeptide (TPR) repeat protein